MNSDLRTHLWKSPQVRSALRIEAFRLVAFILVYVVSIGLFRYFTERPLTEGLYSALIGAFAILFYWSVTAVHTVRAVLRENLGD